MNVISFLISIHYYMILYHIILHIGCIYFHRCIRMNVYSIQHIYYSIRHIEQLKLRSIDIL